MNLKEFQASRAAALPHFVLIGNPVGHSLSPIMHNTAARHYGMQARYHAVAVQEEELNSLPAFLNKEELLGVNVTIPYKQRMLSYVDRLDTTCRKIGALNTIVREPHRLVGYNTDIYGFCRPLEPYFPEIRDGRAVVFGTGGAARAIVHGLLDCGVEEVILVSRSPREAERDEWPPSVEITSYDGWPSFAAETRLFVNATPLGMAPATERSPVGEPEIRHLAGRICYDIVYNPLETKFLKMAAGVDARTIGGLEMLIQQGSRSFDLWTGKPFPVQEVRRTLKTHLSQSR